MKPLLNTDEMINHMKAKGIKFNIISEVRCYTYTIMLLPVKPLNKIRIIN